MIVYSLHCGKGHAFEGWFASMAAFDDQKAGGKLLCPVCNSRRIVKAPMAPALSNSVGEGKRTMLAAPAAPIVVTGEAAAPVHPNLLGMIGATHLIVTRVRGG